MRGPAVVIVRVTPVGDHPVDRRSASQNLATRGCYLAAVEMGFGFADITPVEASVARGDRCRRRHLDYQLSIVAARFDQKHSGARILAESIG